MAEFGDPGATIPWQNIVGPGCFLQQLWKITQGLFVRRHSLQIVKLSGLLLTSIRQPLQLVQTRNCIPVRSLCSMATILGSSDIAGASPRRIHTEHTIAKENSGKSTGNPQSCKPQEALTVYAMLESYNCQVFVLILWFWHCVFHVCFPLKFSAYRRKIWLQPENQRNIWLQPWFSAYRR